MSYSDLFIVKGFDLDKTAHEMCDLHRDPGETDDSLRSRCFAAYDELVTKGIDYGVGKQVVVNPVIPSSIVSNPAPVGCMKVTAPGMTMPDLQPGQSITVTQVGGQVYYNYHAPLVVPLTPAPAPPQPVTPVRTAAEIEAQIAALQAELQMQAPSPAPRDERAPRTLAKALEAWPGYGKGCKDVAIRHWGFWK